MPGFLPRIAAGAALILGMAVAAVPAQAVEFEGTGLTLTLTPSAGTDYLFRGVSQTRNRPAVQGTVELSHDSGFYVGAFASNVAFLNTDARQEVDVYGGYRFTPVENLSVDMGAIGYLYPGYERRGGFNINYFEVVTRLAYQLEPVKFVVNAFYSPDFQAESRNAVYLEGGADVKLPFDFLLAGRIGHQWIDRNERFGLPNFLNWSVAVSREVYGFTLTAGYYDTDIRQRDCAGRQKICDARAMFTVSRAF